MISNFFDVRLTFRIETSESMFVIESITNIIGIQPTTIIKKGDFLSKTLNLISNCYAWELSEKYTECEDIGNVIEDFFDRHPSILTRNIELRKMATVRFIISIVSDFAQVGFTINTRSIDFLKSLNIPCEFSLFSWGGC